MKRIGTELVVIGGGAAGTVAAITAARMGVRVLVVEGNKEIGRKILSTGNGKCNFTNTDISPLHYHGGNEGFISEVLKTHDCNWTIDMFSHLGVWPLEKKGCIYPNSQAAADIRECLSAELVRLGVDVLFDCRIHKISGGNGKFSIFGNRAFKSEAVKITSKAVIIAAGGKSFPHSGSDGEGYEIAMALGHRIVHPLPALAALICAEDYFSGLQSVRVQGRISIFVNDVPTVSDKGELQLRENGISGIPAFQVCSTAARALYEGAAVSAVIDFMPVIPKEELVRQLEQRMFDDGWGKSGTQALLGFLPRGVLEMLFDYSDMEMYDGACDYSPHEIKRLADSIKEFKLSVTGTRDFDAAQTTSGGVNVGDIDPKTMSSKKLSGLFFAGEIIDVDGICGGYNLHWAFSTGDIAGRSAAELVKNKHD